MLITFPCDLYLADDNLIVIEILYRDLRVGSFDLDPPKTIQTTNLQLKLLLCAHKHNVMSNLERLDASRDDVTDDTDLSPLLWVCRQEAGLWTSFLNVLDDGQLS